MILDWRERERASKREREYLFKVSLLIGFIWYNKLDVRRFNLFLLWSYLKLVFLIKLVNY